MSWLKIETGYINIEGQMSLGGFFRVNGIITKYTLFGKFTCRRLKIDWPTKNWNTKNHIMGNCGVTNHTETGNYLENSMTEKGIKEYKKNGKMPGKTTIK